MIPDLISYRSHIPLGIDFWFFIKWRPSIVTLRHLIEARDSWPFARAHGRRSMICNTCKRVLEGLEKVQAGVVEVPHHHCVSCFKQSLEQGCYFCNQFLMTVSLSDQQSITDYAAAVGPCQVADGESPQSIELDHSYFTISELRDSSMDNETPQSSFCLEMRFSLKVKRLFESKSTVKVFLKPLSAPSHSTSSDAALSLASSWIQDCRLNHARCKRLIQEKPWYPSRLISCGSESYQLVDTSKTEVKGPYMTLSHCWGTAETLRLTTKNYDTLSANIPSASLPLLYKEALQVVRRLGVQYLWIDALCIVQEGDNSADWLRQITQMTETYANSYCNISASQALGSHQSLFSQPEPPFWASQKVTAQQTTFLASSQWFWLSEITDPEFGVNTRAWVLQERLVSPRILHFGASQLIWECRQLDASESHPDGIPYRITRHVESGLRFKQLLSDDESGSALSSQEHYVRWLEIVQRYSGCKLTYPSDKLPAISAAAKLFQRTLKDEYIAGLWRGALENQLLWHRSGPFLQVPPGEASGNCRCPSWTWASVDGTVSWSNFYAKGLVEVIDVQLDQITSDSTGPVRDGWLRLRGLLRRISLKTCPCTTDSHWQVTVNGVEFDCSWPCPRVFVDTEERSDQIEEMNEKKALYCMIAAMDPTYAEDKAFTQVLLFEVMNRDKGIYRRIGLVEAFNVPSFTELLQMTQSGQSGFPCERYEDNLHYIKVV